MTSTHFSEICFGPSLTMFRPSSALTALHQQHWWPYISCTGNPLPSLWLLCTVDAPSAVPSTLRQLYCTSDSPPSAILVTHPQHAQLYWKPTYICSGDPPSNWKPTHSCTGPESREILRESTCAWRESRESTHYQPVFRMYNDRKLIYYKHDKCMCQN